MHTQRRLLLIVPSLLTLGCFDDPVMNSTNSSVSETDGDGDGDSGDGDGDGDSGDGDGDQGDGDGDGDPAVNQPPQIDNFAINGDNPPSTVEAASAILLQVVASDPDDNLARVEFEADGQLISFVNGMGPNFDGEWLLSGDEHNGNYTITATAYDLDDLASEPVSLDLGVAMPAGGTEAEQWFYDGGLLDAVYGVAVTPDGDQVVLVGQTITMNGSNQRVDRVVGDVWVDKVKNDSISAAGVVWTGAEFIVAGSLFEPGQFIDSGFYSYDVGGALAESWVINAPKPEVGNPELFDTPNGLARAQSGRLYAIGTFVPQSGPLMGINSSYLLAINASGEQEWNRWPTHDPELADTPLLTEVAVSSDETLATVGFRRGQESSLWLGRWDADGQLTSEYSINDSGSSTGHAVAFGADGVVYVGGEVEDNAEQHSYISRLEADDQPAWEQTPAQVGFGVTTALAVDPWGEVISVSTEDCTQDGGGLSECAVVVRKYDEDGSLIWERSWDTETFSGPLDNLPGYDPSIAVDRFGYIYVTAVSYTDNTGTDWWARKLHP